MCTVNKTVECLISNFSFCLYYLHQKRSFDQTIIKSIKVQGRAYSRISASKMAVGIHLSLFLFIFLAFSFPFSFSFFPSSFFCHFFYKFFSHSSRVITSEMKEKLLLEVKRSGLSVENVCYYTCRWNFIAFFKIVITVYYSDFRYIKNKIGLTLRKNSHYSYCNLKSLHFLHFLKTFVLFNFACLNLESFISLGGLELKIVEMIKLV